MHKTLFLIAFFAIFAFAMFSSSIFAETITNVTNQTLPMIAPVNNLLLNFTVVSNGTANINLTAVNITIPSGVGFISTSNKSSYGAGVVNFTNYGTFLHWNNFTVAKDLFNGLGATAGTTSWFAFNVSTSSGGTFVFTVSTYYNGSVPLTGKFGNVSVTTLTITNGTITLSNDAFSNFTYTGTGLVMNFTATLTPPTSEAGLNQNIYDMLNYTLWINNSLNKNTTNLLGATSITLANTSTAAGFYIYTFNISNTTEGNYTLPSSLTALLMISRATPTASLLITPSNSTTYPTPIAVANGTISGMTDNAGWNISLYRNDTIVNSSTTLLTANESTPLYTGTYNYTLFFNGTQNFTSVSLQNISIVHTGILNLTISGTGATLPGAVSVIPGEYANDFGSDVNYTLWRNNVLVSSAVNSTPTGDTTAGLSVGSYTYVLNSSGGANWTANVTGASVTIGIGAPPTVSGNIGSSGPSGGSIQPQYTNNIGTIYSGTPVTATVSGLYVSQYVIITNDQLQSVQITLTDYGTVNPVTVTPSGKVFNYTLFSESNIHNSDISTATIKFKVLKTWLNSNGLSPSSISLQRFTTIWTTLPTTITGSDNTYVYYSATSPGLSTFAIVGMTPTQTTSTQTTTTTQTTTQTTSQTTTSTMTSTTSTYKNPLSSQSAMTIVAVIIVLFVIIVGSLYYLQRKKKKQSAN